VQQPAAPLRTGASALLAATAIWSTDDSASNSSAAVITTPDDAATARVPPPAVAAPIIKRDQAAETRAAEVIPQRNESAPQPQAPQLQIWPPRRLSLALQGGGSFGAFTWGLLERLLEEPNIEFDAVSGASVGAVNAALLASGLVKGGREGARKLLGRFWNRITKEGSFRSLMLVGGFSPVGSSVAFGQTLRSGQFDPFDLDPLRRALEKDIDFAALRAYGAPKLLLAATRVRDGRLQIFRNQDITADVLVASTCPPLVHCAVEIEGETYWDGGFAANPPVVHLVQESDTSDVLLVQVTPSRDNYIPITSAAIDRRLDQIIANSALNAEIAALEWARQSAATPARIHRIAAEDEIDGLAQRNPVDLGRGFISMLQKGGYRAADRWLRQTLDGKPAASEAERTDVGAPAAQPALTQAALV
jgi:NTE family protein